MTISQQQYVFATFDDEHTARQCNDRQYLFLKRAMTVAQKSTCIHQRHGCVVVKDGEIVAEGYNHHQTHLYHKFSIHAEVHALSKLRKFNKKFISQCTLYVVRIGTDNMGNPLKFSKPCKDCTRAIEKSGIKRVYYSSNSEFEALISSYISSSSSDNSSTSASSY